MSSCQGQLISTVERNLAGWAAFRVGCHDIPFTFHVSQCFVA